MQTVWRFGKIASLAVALAGAALLGTSGNALACEAEYTIKSGDTLGGVAAACDVSLTALTAANRIDPHRLQVGQVIAIPAKGNSGPVVRESSKLRGDAAAASNAYVVRGGDTLSRIARTLGVRTATLLAVNPGLDPHGLQIGQRLNVPNDEEVRQIIAERKAAEERLEQMRTEYPRPVLDARRGEWRQTVDLSARGLAPNETVRVAVSSNGRKWVTLGDMTADAEGEVAATARIPSQLASVPALRFAIQRPWGDAVALTYDRATDAPVRVATAPNTKMTVVGKVVRGGGCDLLVTPRGDSFALAGHRGIRPGQRVIVVGSQQATSDRCAGARAQLRVENINPLPRA